MKNVSFFAFVALHSLEQENPQFSTIPQNPDQFTLHVHHEFFYKRWRPTKGMEWKEGEERRGLGVIIMEWRCSNIIEVCFIRIDPFLPCIAQHFMILLMPGNCQLLFVPEHLKPGKERRQESYMFCLSSAAFLSTILPTN